MFASLEARVPFCNKTVSVARKFLIIFKLVKNQRKLLLIAFKDILSFDKRILNQKKHGFTVPAAKWIVKNIPKMIF